MQKIAKRSLGAVFAFGLGAYSYLKFKPIQKEVTLQNQKVILSSNESIPKNTSQYFDYGVCMIPHPEKAHKGGEDAYFADMNLLSVADGVGGWADYGVDPGLYSKQLCSNIGKLWIERRTEFENTPKKLLIEAAKLTTNIGSSTCVILNLHSKSKLLNTALIGDSGYLIIRKIDNNYKVIFTSPQHTKSFNFPFQIGTEGDDPGLSLHHTHDIENDDLIVLGTDGLFDNLFQNQVCAIIDQYMSESKNEVNYSNLAKMLAEKAFEISNNTKISTPFSQDALNHKFYYKGGKPDDITVLVAKIRLLSKNPV